MSRLFDSHAHYFDSRFVEEYEGGADALLPKLFSDNVEYIVNVGTNNENNKICLEMAKKYEKMYAAVGIHPEDCRDYGREELDRFEEFLADHRDFKKEKIVALADKLSNIRAICRDYEKIGDERWNRFNQKDKNEHAWYYKSFAETLSELSETAAYREYCELTYKIFG